MSAFEAMIAKALVLTAHDIRSRRRANMHFIMSALEQRGIKVRNFSIAFSPLSNIRGRDPRIGLEGRANKVEIYDGIEAFLWRTPLHPGNTYNRLAQLISPAAISMYVKMRPAVLDEWIRDSDVVLIESGLGLAFAKVIRELNKSAKLIYIASDDLDTIRCDPHVKTLFAKYASYFDGACLPSRLLAPSMPEGLPYFYVPHGVDHSPFKMKHPSPFEGGLNAVSVGSMLFDRSFFEIAVELAPQISFHIIGPGVPERLLPKNVNYYPEMPFEKTIPFLQHADFGIAPYTMANTPYYLADTSMKLMQYAHIGLPAVCPHFATSSNHPTRFGYTPGDPKSINLAITSALAQGREAANPGLTWTEVIDRILQPELYQDTAV